MFLLSAGAVIVNKVKKEWLKPYGITSFALVLAFVLTILIIDPEFSNGVKLSKFTSGNRAGMIISFIVMALVAILVPLFLGKKHDIKDSDRTRSIVYASIAVALTFSLSYIRFVRFLYGGSITLVSALPILIYSYMFGIRKGVIAGFVAGVLRAVQDPFVVHAMQFLLDYPLAYALMGLSGIFRELNTFKRFSGKTRSILNFVLGSAVAIALRYLCHVLSGIFVFTVIFPMQWEGMTPVPYSIVYNLIVVVDLAIAGAVGALVLINKPARDMIENSGLLVDFNSEVSGSPDHIVEFIPKESEEEVKE